MAETRTAFGFFPHFMVSFIYTIGLTPYKDLTLSLISQRIFMSDNDTVVK